MSEALEPRNIAEIGKEGFDRLVVVLGKREGEKYNSVGWGGTSVDLKNQIGSNFLCPASAFAVVSDGISRYKRQEPQIYEDTESLRELAKVLSDGSEIYGQANEIDKVGLKDQIKKYVESHGGTFDDSINWQNFIKERSDRLMAKADTIEEANR